MFINSKLFHTRGNSCCKHVIVVISEPFSEELGSCLVLGNLNGLVRVVREDSLGFAIPGLGFGLSWVVMLVAAVAVL